MSRANGRWVLAAAALAIGVAGGASAGDGGRLDDFARGRKLAETLCARCHLNPGQGEKSGPGSIPGFKAVAARPRQSIEGVVAWLKSVPPMMPNHRLTQDEMFQLAQFIMSLKPADE